ncbi:hypothetical protein GIJ05_10660 [Laceyella tengchongensis]|nr:hypothetical protein [Laceyella tengchongensis]
MGGWVLCRERKASTFAGIMILIQSRRGNGTGETAMTLKKLFYWFWSTLALGGVTALVLAFVLEILVGQKMFGDITQQLLLSLTLAAVAELGFFAYLVFNFLAKGLIRNKLGYDVTMLVLTVIILGNLVYLNAVKFSGESFWLHLLIPFIILLTALIVAKLKEKSTNVSAYIPTLFFMVVATILEAIPSINSKAGEIPLLIIFHSVVVLLVCNAWQILQLHRWIKPPAKISQTK